MSQKWTRPRSELIEIGANPCYRGWSAKGVASSMTEQHFLGAGRQQAIHRLTHDIGAAFWQRYGGQTEKQQQVSDMALVLRQEGWHPLFDRDSRGCFWRHQSGVTVNCRGGFFLSFDAATRAAYESQTRAALLSADAA